MPALGNLAFKLGKARFNVKNKQPDGNQLSEKPVIYQIICSQYTFSSGLTLTVFLKVVFEIKIRLGVLVT